MSDASPAEFDEVSYLKRYADVARAVKQGHYGTGYAHYAQRGLSEGRDGSKLLEPTRVSLSAYDVADMRISPDIVMRPPVVYEKHLIGAELLARYDRLWNQRRHPTTVRFTRVPNAIVTGQGLVFDEHQNLLSETVSAASPTEIHQAALSVAEFLENPTSETHPATTLLCEKSGINNYGHWLVEMLPIAFLQLPNLCDRWTLRLPVPSDEGMAKVVRDSVALLGVPAHNTHFAKRQEVHRYAELIVATGLSQHGHFYSPLAVDCASMLLSRTPLVKGASKIWVSRTGSQRCLSEEASLCTELVKLGWHIADTGAMSLVDQIQRFRHAEHVAGVLGAGLTNVVFAGSHAQVTAFVPEQMPDIFFCMLAQLRGQDYREVRCQQATTEERAYSWNCELLMSASAALLYLT